MGEEAAAARKAEEEAAIATKAEEATRAARRVDQGEMAAKRVKVAGAMVKQARDAALAEAVTETKADTKEEAKKVDETSVATRKTMGGRAQTCSDRKGVGAKQDDARRQMLDAGSAPRPSVSALERELEAGAKMPGGAVKAGHALTPSDLAGMGAGTKPARKQMMKAGSSSTPPGPSSEQETKIKAQEPETERPKDQGKEKRTLNAAREALVTEDRAQ